MKRQSVLVVMLAGFMCSSSAEASVTYTGELTGHLDYVPVGGPANGEGMLSYDVTFSLTTSSFITAETNFIRDFPLNFACGDSLASGLFCAQVMFNPSATTPGGPMVEVNVDFISADGGGISAAGFFPLGSLGTDGTFVTDVGSATAPNEVEPLSLTSSNSLSVANSVPEPASWTLMLFGFAGLGLAARRRIAAAQAKWRKRRPFSEAGRRQRSLNEKTISF
jgi:hypothetical protein